MKRYWSAHLPLIISERMTPAEHREWSAVNNALTADDVVAMQTIDADCNDCRRFQRGAMERHPGLVLFRGTCAKDGNAVTAYPGQYSGRECFSHRRA